MGEVMRGLQVLTSGPPILGAACGEEHPSPFEVGAGKVEGGLNPLVDMSGEPVSTGAIAVDQDIVSARDSQLYTLVEGRAGDGSQV